MTQKGPSPLLGYNTNVRHRGKLYHIQTEDSGVKHPHIITHLFADGGRIISSKKTSYSEHVGAENYQLVVKKLMQEQHKAMFIALRDGEFDEGEPPSGEIPLEQLKPQERRSVDVDALERAADRLSGDQAPAKPPSQRPAAEGPSPGRYSSTFPARAEQLGRKTVEDSSPPESIFGSDLLSEKSLDEVILSYLAEDLEEPD